VTDEPSTEAQVEASEDAIRRVQQLWKTRFDIITACAEEIDAAYRQGIEDAAELLPKHLQMQTANGNLVVFDLTPYIAAIRRLAPPHEGS
jgi:hypothetical protein